MSTFAGYPVASGRTSKTANYIPNLFANQMLKEFYPTTVFGAITNTDYQGRIKEHGDRVTIRRTPEIQVHDYVVGQKLIRQDPHRAPIDMVIDKGKYWSFKAFDVERAQSDIDYVRACAEDAAQRMAIRIDTDLLSALPATVHPSNAGITAGARSSKINLGVAGTPLAITPANALRKLTEMMLVLDEQNVPTTGRFVVLPHWYCMLLINSDIKSMDIGGPGPRPMRNGRLGTIANFTIYQSNNLTVTATDGAFTNCTDIIFGHKVACSFATQIVKRRMIPNYDDFGDLIEGLQVYGHKTVQPKALGYAYAYWSSE